MRIESELALDDLSRDGAPRDASGQPCALLIVGTADELGELADTILEAIAAGAGEGALVSLEGSARLVVELEPDSA